MAIELKKCACRNCCNFFTATLKQHQKKYCCKRCQYRALYYNNVDRMREKGRINYHKADSQKNKVRLASCEMDGCENFFTAKNWRKKYCCKKCKENNYYHKNAKKLNEKSKKFLKEKRKKNPKFRQEMQEKAKREWRKMYYSLTPEEKLEMNRRKYAQVNMGKRRKKARETKRERYHKDLNYRLSSTMRSRISRALRNNNIQYKKSNHSIDLLGCSIMELKAHLEKNFTDGMSWENYGDWHVDHIRPCASFKNLGEDPEQQRDCFHYSNLQPLWAKDNLIKSDKY